jgi:hypothetical protein
MTNATDKADRKPAHFGSFEKRAKKKRVCGQALSLADRFGQTFVREWANEGL